MPTPKKTERSPRNKTVTLSAKEKRLFKAKLQTFRAPVTTNQVLNTTINQDVTKVVSYLPDQFVDLLVIDPPYNRHRQFNNRSFNKMGFDEYLAWMNEWLPPLKRLLKPTASIYICGDWQSSPAIYLAIRDLFIIQNRITWEREKGRGAKQNWKNCMEDIWYCTNSKTFTFNTDAVKQKRRVIAPYTHKNGEPKDWDKTEQGNFRLTHPSNLWSDLSIPFWSMKENTDHPTQKPEKLLAKIILASSNPGDVVLDPFLGSGTTSVVAKKLKRNYVGIEIDKTYCYLAEKRLLTAETEPAIQGYHDGVFWERNTHPTKKE